jgi:hypothetical protein
VKATTTGNQRTRISVAFTAIADGRKLSLFALIPRTGNIDDLDNLPNVICEYKPNSTFNDVMIIQYLTRVVVPYKLEKSFSKILLLLDHATCHLTERVSDFCEDNGILLLFIPKRLTNLLQPADVCWFSTIKKDYKAKWNDWFIYDEKSFTIHDNMRSPGYVKAMQWLSECWVNLESDLVRRSFSLCGIKRHPFEDGKLMVETSDLHTVLQAILKQGFTSWIDNDVDLEEAENQLTENDPEFSENPRRRNDPSMSRQENESPGQENELEISPGQENSPEEDSQEEMAGGPASPSPTFDINTLGMNLLRESQASIIVEPMSTSTSISMVRSIAKPLPKPKQALSKKTPRLQDITNIPTATRSASQAGTSGQSVHHTTSANTITATLIENYESDISVEILPKKRGRKVGSLGKKKRDELGLPSPSKKTKKN